MHSLPIKILLQPRNHDLYHVGTVDLEVVMESGDDGKPVVIDAEAAVSPAVEAVKEALDKLDEGGGRA